MMSDNSVAPVDTPMLSFNRDIYGGARLNSQDQNIQEFDKRLVNSLAHWLEIGVTGVWIKILNDHASLVAICVKHGFDFHHAQPGYVMMTRWLGSGPSRLPPFANQYLGSAGMAVNDRGQVLVVKERYSSSLARWKLPGGHADTGEDIATAALRETEEETGIKCEFLSLMCIRHMHDYKYGLSDLYAVCLLKPLSEDIEIDDRELSDCRWMDIDEWLAGDVTGINRFSGELYQEYRRGETPLLAATDVPSWNLKKMNKVYHAQQRSHRPHDSESHS